MSKVLDKLSKVLKNKKTVITRAVFWKIPHNSRPEEVHLKLGRYRKPTNFDEEEVPESLHPKSELTLDNDEFLALITLLRENYEPFKQGVKEYIPIDDKKEAQFIRQLKHASSSPDVRKMIKLIMSNDIISDELVVGLRSAQRIKAIKRFEEMLQKNLVEAKWQEWFEENTWVLGSDFVRVLDERHIDTSNISDFLMEAYDGFLDIVEIKRPEGGMQFWASTKDHDNFIPSTHLIKAIAQASRYIYEVEREANSIKFLERVDGIRTVKPRCILVFGRSVDWCEGRIEAFRVLNSGYHNLSLMTYDHVLERAKRIVGMASLNSEV